MFEKLLRTFSGFIQGGRSSAAARCPRRARLRLEALEDRCTPATFTVNTLSDTPVFNLNNHNAHDANGNVSLRSAIQQANFESGADTIQFSSTLSGTIDELIAMESIITDINIQGPGTTPGNSPVSVARSPNAQVSFSLFTIVGQVDGPPTCTISGLTITSGDASSGGAIYNDGTLTLISCDLTCNYATNGGAIYNGMEGQLWVEGCNIGFNAAENGGGIYNEGGTVTVYAYSEITSNSASRSGGGIYSTGSVDIYGSTTIINNTAEFHGGGIWAEGTLSVSGSSSITYNTADLNGGGVYIQNASATLSGVDIEYNSADKGGGVYIGDSGSVDFTSCNVQNNSATTRGPGICYLDPGAGYTIHLGNYQNIINDP